MSISIMHLLLTTYVAQTLPTYDPHHTHVCEQHFRSFLSKHKSLKMHKLSEFKDPKANEILKMKVTHNCSLWHIFTNLFLSAYIVTSC